VIVVVGRGDVAVDGMMWQMMGLGIVGPVMGKWTSEFQTYPSL